MFTTRFLPLSLPASLVATFLMPVNIFAQDVMVTIKPLHSLVSGVMGSTGQAGLIVDDAVSPHDFQLKPSQVKAVQDARVIFYIDNDFETFLRRAFDITSEDVRKVAVAGLDGLKTYSIREGGGWEGHAHDHHGHEDEHDDHDDHDKHGHDDHDDHDKHDHDKHAHDDHDDHGKHDHDKHAHEDHDEHDKHDHDKHAHEDHDEHDKHAHEDHEDHETDLHLWLDPANAKVMVDHIAQELSAIYPENASVYTENASSYTKRLDALHTELQSSLRNVQDKPYVVFHDAYQYFEAAYGLNAVGSITFQPDESPSPARLQEVSQRIKETGATCVFKEPQFSDRLVRVVVEGTSARSGTLDPLGAGLENGPDLYIALLEDLASNLRSCLN